jgi:serine/threonine protein kinase
MTYEQFHARYKYNAAIDLIGGGGFGKVFKAFDDLEDRVVAIKVAEVNRDYENLSLFKEVDLGRVLTFSF